MRATPYSNDILTIAGGTGFLGTHIIRAAALAGLRIRVLTRHPEKAYACKTSGVVGQIAASTVDYNNKAQLVEILRNSRYVVNCIGQLAEAGKNSFARVHTDYARNLAEAAAEAGVERFVQISALGCDRNPSRYAATKLEGEQAVLKAFPLATILRPSVQFGPEDSFLNRFARLATLLPVMPLIGGGKTLMQPVFVGDVAAAVIACLQAPTLPGYDVRGRVFALGGPEVKSLAEITRSVLAETGIRRPLITLPFWLAKVQAVLLQFFPPPLQLTFDQIKSLSVDNIVSDREEGFAELGIYPTAMSLITPTYLQTFQRGGKFQHMRQEEGVA